MPHISETREELREHHVLRAVFVHAKGTAFALFALVLLPFVHAKGTALAIFALLLLPFVLAKGTAVALFAVALLPLVFAAPTISFHPHAACKLGIWITNLVRNLGFLNLNRSHSLSDRQWPRLRRDAFGRARVEYSREHSRDHNVSDSRGK